jgi:CCR4-NOT transcription complex subunit 3
VAAGFPKEPLPIFDDPRLYSRLGPDTLFYVFYYEQGSAHQYLAATALKGQNWRFHKQYQTWFQRHEPNNITGSHQLGGGVWHHRASALGLHGTIRTT